MSRKRLAVIGGGAAGFFGAITAAEANPNLEVYLFEKSKELLGKVKVSGGGRCNVTHACFEPKELVKFYPRGQRELLGPFNKFCSGDTMDWFERRGVRLKIESDNRVFPVSDSSQTIMNCLLYSAEDANVHIHTRAGVDDMTVSGGKFNLKLSNGTYFSADSVLYTPGSSNRMWDMLADLGHSIVNPVPSLFTFNIKDSRLTNLAGISVPNAHVSVPELDLEAEGPLLVTHWGLSGPGILRLSAWGARVLNETGYKFKLKVNWLPDLDEQDILNGLESMKIHFPKRQPVVSPFEEIPKRLWLRLIEKCGIQETQHWADIPKNLLQKLAFQLHAGVYEVSGKSTFKEEFVTAGGVDLKEVDFRNFESKVVPNLFFAGEVIDVDAITGGFNFQNAWTGGYLAGKAIAERFA